MSEIVELIVKVSRKHPMWKNQTFSVLKIHGDLSLEHDHSIPVPDTVIICDSCGHDIETEVINVRVENDLVVEALCETCRVKYFSELEMIREECPFCNDLVKNFRDEKCLAEFNISGMCQQCQDNMFKELIE